MRRNIDNVIMEGRQKLAKHDGYDIRMSEYDFFRNVLINEGEFFGILKIFQYGVAIGYRMAQKHESRKAKQ